LWQLNAEKAKEDITAVAQKDDGRGVKDFMSSMGMGALGDQVKTCRLCLYYCIIVIGTFYYLH